jgi:hypothetical protein
MIDVTSKKSTYVEQLLNDIYYLKAYWKCLTV